MVHKHANAYIFYLNNHLKIQTTSLSNTYFIGSNAVFQELWCRCSTYKVLIYFIFVFPCITSLWPRNSTVLTDLDIYTGFIPTQLMTNTSGCCYSL